MVIKDNTVEQINVALLDLEKKINSATLDAKIKSLETNVDNIKRSLNETKVGLDSGATYNINITGNATTATSAITSTSATIAETAERATAADHADSADNIVAGGTSGQVLTSNGSLVLPSWQDSKLNMTTLYAGSYGTANGSITLSDSIENYSAIIVMGAMWGGSVPDQIVPVFVPKVAYYWMGTNGYEREFLINGSIDSSTRRIYFGFSASTPTVLYTGNIQGASGNTPVLKYVVGIK
jgi:hypothetical protein